MVRSLSKALVVVCISFSALVLTGLAMSAIDKSKKSETYRELELFADALAFVQTQYVDETSPKDLIYGAMGGMLSALDPHSQFMTPQEYEELRVDTEGKFGGVGIEITVKDNLITVITAIEGTPAWEAGLMTNDRIVKIDDVVIKNFTLGEAVKKLRGKPGTEVTIVVWREKDSALHSFTIRRAVINIKDIKEARMLMDGIAYLKIVEFRENTPQELDRALKDLREKGMDSLILDLRNNPGGLLDKAVEVTQRFVPKGALLVFIRGRDPKQSAEFRSNYRSPDLTTPIVLLVNEGSASGSEIMAGALKDLRRAILLGVATFGKGSVQTVLPLRDGSALKLTTSRYMTPLGHSIQEKGIVPDIVVEQREAPKTTQETKVKDLEKIFEDVEKKSPPVRQESPEDKTIASDTQLSRAVDLLKSLRIYDKTLRENAL